MQSNWFICLKPKNGQLVYVQRVDSKFPHISFVLVLFWTSAQYDHLFIYWYVYTKHGSEFEVCSHKKIEREWKKCRFNGKCSFYVFVLYCEFVTWNRSGFMIYFFKNSTQYIDNDSIFSIFRAVLFCDDNAAIFLRRSTSFPFHSSLFCFLFSIL